MAKSEKAACIWHAFNALDVHQSGTVPKRQLKVLTHNIGNILGLQNVEKSLEEFRSSDDITFLDYFYSFLKVEFFSQLENKFKEGKENTAGTPPAGRHAHKVRALLAVARCDWDKIDEVCWFVCCKKYVALQQRVFCEDLVYKLWRVFNFVAETDGEEVAQLVYPVVVDKEETLILVGKLVCVTQVPFDQEAFMRKHEDTERFSFEGFLEVLGQACTGDGTIKPDVDMVTLAVGEVYDEYIVEVMKKGYMVKKGHMMTNWKERWFVLTPHYMRYYTSRDEKDMKGEVTLTRNCKVETLPDKSSTKPHRLQLVSEGKTFEISAPDMKSRSEWITAFKQAIDYSNKNQSPQRAATVRRRTVRDEHRCKEEEERRSLEEERRQMELTQQQLLAEQEALAKAKVQLEELTASTEAEKEARAEAEARLQAEAHLREELEQKLKELGELNQELERLLDAEKLAIRDEEIVRNLQARVLAEEFAKREQLEHMQEEMQHKFQEEHERRQDLEQWKEEQDRRLQEEQQKLQELKQERMGLDQSLQEALEKLSDAEHDRGKLQEKLKTKKEKSNFIKDQLAKLPDLKLPLHIHSHRGLGFLPDFLTSPSSSSESSFSLSPEKEIPETNNNDPNQDDDVNGLDLQKVKVTENDNDLEVKGGENGGLVETTKVEHDDGVEEGKNSAET